MSTIPSGLNANDMRKSIEDKATITEAGGLYMGSNNAVTIRGLNRFSTVCCAPGIKDTLLISKGSGQMLVYEQLSTSAFTDFAINWSKLGAGVVVQPQVDSGKAPTQLNIGYTSNSSTKRIEFDYAHGSKMDLVKTGSPRSGVSSANQFIYNDKEYSVVKFLTPDDNNPKVTWCKKYDLSVTTTAPTSAAKTAWYTECKVDRSNSPYAEASTGRIINHSESNVPVYWDDQLSLLFKVAAGWNVSGTINNNPIALAAFAFSTAQDITVKGDIKIQFQATPLDYKYLFVPAQGTYNDSYSLTVTRTSSPYKNAPNKVLTSGDTVYFGDVLDIYCVADDAYRIVSLSAGGVELSAGVHNTATVALGDFIVSVVTEQVKYPLVVTNNEEVTGFILHCLIGDNTLSVTVGPNQEYRTSLAAGTVVRLWADVPAGYLMDADNITYTSKNNSKTVAMDSSRGILWGPSLYLAVPAESVQVANVVNYSPTPGGKLYPYTYSLAVKNNLRQTITILGLKNVVGINMQRVRSQGSTVEHHELKNYIHSAKFNMDFYADSWYIIVYFSVVGDKGCVVGTGQYNRNDHTTNTGETVQQPYNSGSLDIYDGSDMITLPLDPTIPITPPPNLSTGVGGGGSAQISYTAGPDTGGTNNLN